MKNWPAITTFCGPGLCLSVAGNYVPTGPFAWQFAVSKMLTKWSNYDLLILDEFLLNDLTQPEQLFLFELIERRYDKASTIFCTQYRMEDWHTRLGGGVHADAILDGIIHNVEIVFAGKLNMRKIESVKEK